MAQQWLLMLICCIGLQDSYAKYTPDWDSLDSRPLPTWYDEAKFGIFVHWGVFSVPSFHGAWFWPLWKSSHPAQDIADFMKRNYPPDFTYADFASDFTAEFFNPDEWADKFKASGAGYVVLTSKHGEGFPNWPSSHSFNWNAKAVGPNRDLVGDLAAAIRNRTDIKFGTYYCLSEWLHPLYLKDKESNFTTQSFVKTKTMPDLYELVSKYNPEIVWADMVDDLGPSSYWTAKEFLAWLFNESPVKDTVVTNDRWGPDCKCKHGSYKTCTDKFNPDNIATSTSSPFQFEDNGMSRHSGSTFFEVMFLFENILLIFNDSCGGNMLMNVGPTKYGKIMPIFEERLRQFGQWLKVNGEGVYGTVPWSHQNDTVTRNTWYTKHKRAKEGTVVYAFLLSWPTDTVLKLGAPIPSQQTEVSMLGYPDKFIWKAGPGGQGIYITIPIIPWNKLSCEWAWLLKITHITN
ncbi:FUCA [Mytilus coruscus]|uniref:alpha-L-fucosidase n=1 Tax=Mytilus coruscus TaxID=42192 RepID=A0A6J8AGX9_MYTCO|nr:FUCA [Mytilus coruscus]